MRKENIHTLWRCQHLSQLMMHNAVNLVGNQWDNIPLSAVSNLDVSFMCPENTPYTAATFRPDVKGRKSVTQNTIPGIWTTLVLHSSRFGVVCVKAEQMNAHVSMVICINYEHVCGSNITSFSLFTHHNMTTRNWIFWITSWQLIIGVCCSSYVKLSDSGNYPPTLCHAAMLQRHTDNVQI